MLFTIPTHAPDIPSSSDTGNTMLRVAITDGVSNGFNPGSITWEVYADDPADNATVTARTCSTDTAVTPQVTTCEATLSTSDPGDYEIFVSGHGVLGTVARHFEEATITIVPGDECEYFFEGGIYDKHCPNHDPPESLIQERLYINNTHVADVVTIRKYPNGLIIATSWERIVDTSFMVCYPSIPVGWFVSNNDDANGNNEYISRIPGGHFPESYLLNTVSTYCYPDSQWYPYQDCGEYYCPDRALNIPPTIGFPGDCHQWWDHFDGQGNWVECDY
jgi:hypothetical protein